MIKALLADPQMHAALQNLLSAVAVAIGTLAGLAIKVAMNLLQARIHSEHNALYAAAADRLVKYAEQRFNDSSNALKSDYVTTQLIRQFPQLPQNEVQHLLEQAVVNMQTAMVQPKVDMNVNLAAQPTAPVVPGGLQ